jgi:hypothetical protein
MLRGRMAEPQSGALSVQRHRRRAGWHRADGRAGRHDGGAIDCRPQCRDAVLPARHAWRTNVRGTARAKPTSSPARTPPSSKRSIARGKGQQKVTVEHIHVHGGGQRPWSASSVDRGVGIERNRRNNPMQSKLPIHLSPRCQARTRAGTPCQSAAMANRALPDARRQSTGSAEGQ